VISAPVITCEEGFEKIGHECIQRTPMEPTPSCPEPLTMSADGFKCEGIRKEAPVAFCEDSEMEPRSIDGVYYCETLDRETQPIMTCNDGFEIDVNPANGRSECKKVQWEMPMMRCEDALGYRLIFDIASAETRCEISTFAEADVRCDNVMADEVMEVDPQTGDPTNVLDYCSVRVTEPTVASCDEEEGFFFEKNICYKTVTGTPIDDCQNGQYDSLADVCYTHRYVTGDYICPEGCQYDKATLNCVCRTRTTPTVHCPVDCYRHNQECFKNVIKNDVTVCPENFGYDLAKDMCVHEVRSQPVSSCEDGSPVVNGYCHFEIKKPQTLMCPYGYTLRDEVCIKLS